ncbi:microfibril-associated glycoprotein 4-like [Glandiceps talaboti]
MKSFILASVLLILNIGSVCLQATTVTGDQACRSYTFVVPPGDMCNCETLESKVDKLTTRVQTLEAAVNRGGSNNGATYYTMSIYQDCQELMTDRNIKHKSGIYLVQPKNAPKSFHVWCEIDITGASTVIQRRMDGSVSFNRDWADYKKGFGQLDGEYWLGNEHIHQLTSQGEYQLHIEMEDWEGNAGHAKYNMFELGDENDKYRLDIDGYSGDIGDSLTYHDGQQFSTRDTDNDVSGHENCAVLHESAWWYRSCHWSNLNGVYHHTGRYSFQTYATGVEWKTWKNKYGYSMKTVTMKIKLQQPE